MQEVANQDSDESGSNVPRQGIWSAGADPCEFMLCGTKRRPTLTRETG